MNLPSSSLRYRTIVQFCLRLLAFSQCFGWFSGSYAANVSEVCAQCQNINTCFQVNETCVNGYADGKEVDPCKTRDEVSRTTLIVLICFLSSLLVTTLLLVAIFAFLKRRRGRLHLNETHEDVDIRIEDQDVPHHYDDAQDIDKCIYI